MCAQNIHCGKSKTTENTYMPNKKEVVQKCWWIHTAEYYEAIKKENADLLSHCTGMKTPPKYTAG